MAVYAAMVDRLDRNIGRILDKLQELGQAENTLVMFLSDNGGCPYERNGPAESYRTYDSPWANVSNTPFRLYKRFSHEGGSATPFIVRWPNVIKKTGSITHQMGHIVDVMATCLEIGKAKYPRRYKERQVLPHDGQSLLPIFQGRQRKGHEAIFWEYMRNKAVRRGKWKAVTIGDGPWELFDMQADRTELNDLAKENPRKLKELAALYDKWRKSWAQKPKGKAAAKNKQKG